MAEPRRISQTLIKPLGPSREQSSAEGFRAELPGWDLASLLQLTCARGTRACVEVQSGAQTGYVYLNEGRILHASVGSVMGEAAIQMMLSWRSGAFALRDRPWPLKPTIDQPADLVLLRAAQTRDEAERGPGLRTTPFAVPIASIAPFVEVRSTTAKQLERAADAEPRAAAIASGEGALLASVRIDMNGEIIARHGAAEKLAPLVGYVTRMGALLGSQLGLEAFEALSADLGSERALVFVEGNEMVGLLLAPGALFQEMRQQLGL